MLVFITSVRHPQNSQNYGVVEELLRRTLDSVVAQTVDDYRVVVVCNRAPAGPAPARVRYVEVDFPPPSPEPGAVTGREAVVLDKGTKLAVGLLAAQEYEPDYIMKFDADDFVSRRIAEFVHGARDPGWYVDDGYVVSAATGLIAPCPGFNDNCGTSEIVANRLFELPGDAPSLRATQEELLAVLGERLVRDLLGSHRHSVAHFAALGTPLSPLPFPGAVYTVATGENHSGRTWSMRGRPISRDLAEEFGLAHLRARGGWTSVVRRDVRATARRLRMGRLVRGAAG